MILPWPRKRGAKVPKKPDREYPDLGHQDRGLDKIIVGFTGTREGMTTYQKNAIRQMMIDVNVLMGHHGDCIGGDEEFDYICHDFELPVHLHPPDDPRYRAFCMDFYRTEEPRPYLVRNRVIVNSVNLLIAAPKETFEPMAARGQGTWSTIRYARQVGRLLRIVWPE
jgi:hypothetical protein